MSKEAKKYFSENIERLGGTYAVMQAYADEKENKLIESIKSDPVLLTEKEKELFIGIIQTLKQIEK